MGYADFETRPLQRPGELVEVVPGMVATQHSGEGKANQYFLRGMNLDHGTDFSAWFEGMPVNLRAHAHGQGYLDLNFLIPEIVDTVRYAKGPYSADRGDFSTAGTATFSVYGRLDAPFVDLSGGDGHYGRLVAAGSRQSGAGNLLGALEAQHNDGPWELPAHVDKTNLLLRWSGPWRAHDASVTAMAYDNSWNSTDQVPERLVESARIGRFGFVDRPSAVRPHARAWSRTSKGMRSRRARTPAATSSTSSATSPTSWRIRSMATSMSRSTAARHWERTRRACSPRGGVGRSGSGGRLPTPRGHHPGQRRCRLRLRAPATGTRGIQPFRRRASRHRVPLRVAPPGRTGAG